MVILTHQSYHIFKAARNKTRFFLKQQSIMVTWLIQNPQTLVIGVLYHKVKYCRALPCRVIRFRSPGQSGSCCRTQSPSSKLTGIWICCLKPSRLGSSKPVWIRVNSVDKHAGNYFHSQSEIIIDLAQSVYIHFIADKCIQYNKM